MGKPTYTVHTGRQSWWDSSFRTDCGIRWKAGNHRHIRWSEKGKHCQECQAARKRKNR